MPHPLSSTLLRHLLIALPGVTLVVACAAEPARNSLDARPAPPAAASLVVAPDEPVAPMDFAGWVTAFRAQALAEGISPALFDRAFAGMTPDPQVVQADHSQPEFSRPVWEYLDSALSGQRVATGRRLLGEHAETLARVERQYGVDRYALVAIWGLESNFGRVMGNKSVIRSLATLAYEGRRPEFARSQLLAALRILEQGDISPERMQGSWAGAMGQTQFIPTTYQDYAVDFDGDGRRDIWSSAADALASAGHYLQQSGCRSRPGGGFGGPRARGFDDPPAAPAVRTTGAEGRALGVEGIPAGDSQAMAGLILPAGHRGPAFLAQDNFRSVLRYNNSTSYALAVSLLAERLQGGGQVNGRWPTEDRPLSRSERIELQERLAALGFEPGAADSIIGANTRRAVREYQRALGWPADGYPTPQLLERLRAEPQVADSAARQG